jgi:hypothetical protein
MQKTIHGVLFGLVLVCGCGSGGGGTDGAASGSPPVAIESRSCPEQEQLTLGCFSAPFAEPWPSDMSVDAAPGNYPVNNPLRQFPQDDRCLRQPDGRPIKCKPAAASVALLPDDRVLYFNALEGTEDVEYSIFFEAGHAIVNDQTRLLELAGDRARWSKPTPVDGGANPDGNDHTLLLPPGTIDNAEGPDGRRTNNDGALFCADLELLADGRVIAVGGTDYYAEPGINTPFAFGVSELEGLRNARIFDPADNTWRKTGDMHFGRWYPSLVTLADGDLFVASGVTKLLKPIYPERLQTSGRNVTQTETYDLGCGTWTENGLLAERSLPLYPRLHLLPNGHVLYNAAGQAFNPFGQAYDQALWNIAATYDPVARRWSDLGVAGLPSLPPEDAADLPTLLLGSGFRGSSFSIMLPLRPDAQGNYDRAEFLTAGGVLGGVALTSPGLHVGTNLSRIDTVEILPTGQLRYTSRATGPLNAGRWYGTAVLLPTGEVMVFSGADRDEVQVPGGATPILRSESFNPRTETWRPMAVQGRPRTYHNTAMLLPDGRVLVAGHAPINTAYAYSINLPGMSPNDGRDPSFEIYSPPYVFQPRPTITSAPSRLRHGESFRIVSPQAATIASVLLVRRTSLTHIVDGDQRSVELNFSRQGETLLLRLPANSAVVPPGPYMLFVNQRQGDRLVPSTSKPVMVLGADTRCTPE